MTFDTDDPRLTAFALGELDESERPAVEAFVAQNDEARRLVEEVQALAHLLTDQLRAEPSPMLFPAQRQAIECKAQGPAVIATLPSFARVLRYGVAAGALAIVSGAAYITWQARQHREAAPLAPEARVESMLRDRDVAYAAPAKPSGRNRAPAASEPAILAKQSAGAAPIAVEGLSDRFSRSPADHLGATARGDLAYKPATQPARDAAGIDAAIAFNDGAAASPPAGSVPPPTNNALSLGVETPPATSLAATTGIRGLSSGSTAQGPRGYLSRAAGSSGDGYGAGGGMGGMMKAPGLPGLGKPADAAKLGFEGESMPAGAKASSRTVEVRAGLSISEEKLRGGQDARANNLEDSSDFREANLGERKDAASDKKDQGRDESFALQIPAEEAARAKREGAVTTYYRKLAEQQQGQANTAQFGVLVENEFKAVTPQQQNLSTFAADVDTASYANVRRFLMQDAALPPPGAVRVEEMINYFTYDYPEPSGDTPFSVDTEVTRCPWNADHWLFRVGLKARSVSFQNRKPANLVFLVDASGSMDQPAKMPLVKAGLRMLVNQLGENDKISIVTYANGSGVALQPTIGYRKAEILEAIDRIQPGGSTNGAAGINTAYDMAQQNFIKDGINRVILLTDGDFNVGTTDDDSLVRMAGDKAKSGVFLSTMGFGSDNLQDRKLEQIADKGNGQYAVVDNLLEARKNFVEQVGGTLVTVAKDVKFQVEFNPAKVGAYRQIGYENRAMAAEDFRDDSKDAGEIGSGHTVTALYELVPPGEEAAKLAAKVPPSEFVKPAEVTDEAKQGDKLLTVYLRYKQPDGDTATEIKQPVKAEFKDLGQASSDTKFAASVAWFGMYIRMSKFVNPSTPIDAILELAEANKGRDAGGYRAEFVEIVKKAKTILPAQ